MPPHTDSSSASRGGSNSSNKPGSSSKGGVPAAAGQQVPQCVAARAELLGQVQALQLPPNFLDLIVDELGGPEQVCVGE